MADNLHPIYFHDGTFEFQISKVDLEKRANEFYRTCGQPHQLAAGELIDKAELRALAGYARAVKKLFLIWKAISTALHQEIKDRNGDVAPQSHLDQLDALLQQAEALAAPDRAAGVQRVFIAMLRSEQAFFQNVFDDVDNALIEQYAADFQEEATIFLAEFDRLLRISSPSL